MLSHTRDIPFERFYQANAFLFYCRDYEKPIHLSSEGAPAYRHDIEISPLFNQEDKIKQSIVLEGVKSNTGSVYPTGLKYQIRKKPKELRSHKNNGVEPDIVVDYLPSQKIDANTLPNFTRIVELGQKEELIAFLSSFDRRIVGVELIGEEILIRLEGIKYLMPLQVAGDGLRRFISVWSAIANPDNRVVLIDEVDNGIHHSSYRLLWEMILKTAKENNVQLFITTHSDESLMGLVEAHENLAESERAEAGIYSVAHTKSGVKAYRYEVASYEKVREGHVDPRN